MQEWYSAKELSILNGMPKTPQGVTFWANKNSVESRPRKGRGGGKEYHISSLPEETKIALALADTNSKALVLSQESAMPVKADPLPSPDAIIPDWSNNIGLCRYRIVMEWRAYICKNKNLKKTVATQDFLAAYHSGLLLPYEHKTIGETSDKTIYRWNSKLKKADDDYRALCDGRGKWKVGGAKGLGQLSPEIEAMILQCYLHVNKPSVVSAYRATKAVADRQDLKIPSQVTINRFIKRFTENNSALVTLKREGEKALKDKEGPYITRNANLLSVGDAIFCDGHVLNFHVAHPVTGKPHRPTLIMWFDWRSRMPVGWTIMPTENTVSISVALHMAIGTLGQYPRVVYIDNGKAFKSKYFTAEADLKENDGLYSRLGIAAQYSRPYEARTKIVERFFRTLNEQMARMIPSYCGQNIMDKPAWRMRNEKYHEARHDAVTNGYKLTMQDTSEIITSYVRWYGQQPHDGIQGSRPLDLLMAGRGDGVDVRELDRHFLFRHQFTPSRCRVRIGGVSFEGQCLYGIKKKLTAMYNWADMSEIFIYDEQGNRLGTAKPVEALHPLAKHFGDELDLIKIQEANKLQGKLKSDTLKLARAHDKAFGTTSPLTQLPFVARARAPLKAIIQPKNEPVEPILPPEEAEQLEALSKQLEALPVAPTVNKPEWFENQYEYYTWCFEQVVQDGNTINQEDMDFMAEYEAGQEYKENTGKRFDQLRELYAENLADQAIG